MNYRVDFKAPLQTNTPSIVATARGPGYWACDTFALTVYEADAHGFTFNISRVDALHKPPSQSSIIVDWIAFEAEQEAPAVRPSNRHCVADGRDHLLSDVGSSSPARKKATQRTPKKKASKGKK